MPPRHGFGDESRADVLDIQLADGLFVGIDYLYVLSQDVIISAMFQFVKCELFGQQPYPKGKPTSSTCCILLQRLGQAGLAFSCIAIIHQLGCINAMK